MSHALLILKINTTFEDVQMILRWSFGISTGFRFWSVCTQCSVHICSCPWLNEPRQSDCRVPFISKKLYIRLIWSLKGLSLHFPKAHALIDRFCLKPLFCYTKPKDLTRYYNLNNSSIYNNGLICFVWTDKSYFKVHKKNLEEIQNVTAIE